MSRRADAGGIVLSKLSLETHRYHAPLHWFALATTAATLLLICAGGLVTSHGAGLAVPDWPNTYGYNLFFFPVSGWVGGIFYEHTHRLVGALVGFMTLVLAIWMEGRRARRWLGWSGLLFIGIGIAALASGLTRADSGALMILLGVIAGAASRFWPGTEPAPRWLRLLGWCALAGVIVQGILGGLRVVLLEDQIGVIHATLAQAFLAFMAAIALFTSRWWHRLPQSEPARFPAVCIMVQLLTAGVLLQLVLGAAMRHRHAGLAVPDFPLAHGRIWPRTDAEAISQYNQQRVNVRAMNDVTAADVYLHMAHRGVAVALVLGLTFAAARVRKRIGPRHLLARGLVAWAVLGWLQLGLGAATVWTNKSADLATAHVALGSLILMTGALLSIVSARKPAVAAVSRSDALANVPTSVAPARLTSCRLPSKWSSTSPPRKRGGRPLFQNSLN
jgi:cytochrome c oxidase assembly protein subunit 15